MKERIDYEEKFVKLVDIIKTLRGPHGCPWDKEQTPEDVKTYLLEEAYELVEGIKESDMEVIKEELGDVLLLIIFLADYYQKKGEFCLSEVLEGISNKLVRRHPHVFSDKELDSTKEVIKNWNKLKEEERDNKKRKNFLDGIPKSAPALLRTYLFVKKAGRFHKINLDTSNKMTEEIKEIINSKFSESEDKKEKEEKVARLLFEVTKLSAKLEIDPESILLKYLENYSNKFLLNEE